MFRILPAAVVLSSTICFAFAQTSDRVPSEAGSVLVEIDGQPITAPEFDRKLSSALFQARNTFYETQRKALDQLIDEYLLERQARKENVTTSELLKRHVESQIGKDPSDEVLQVYYEGVDSNEPFETAKDKIRDYIRQRRMARAKAAYLKSLRSQANVTIHLEPPRVQISLAGTPIRGSKGAPVTVVEFADYECPYCQVIHPFVKKLQAEFGDKVSFAFKDLPLPSHANAQKAAEAAHCAGAQGQYWEYHDHLFVQKQYDLAKLKDYARALQLNGEVFDKCLESGTEAGRVNASLAEAQALLIPGTPAFFVNGRFLTGAVSYDILRNAITEELAKTSATKVAISTQK